MLLPLIVRVYQVLCGVLACSSVSVLPIWLQRVQCVSASAITSSIPRACAFLTALCFLMLLALEPTLRNALATADTTLQSKVNKQVAS